MVVLSIDSSVHLLNKSGHPSQLNKSNSTIGISEKGPKPEQLSSTTSNATKVVDTNDDPNDDKYIKKKKKDTSNNHVDSTTHVVASSTECPSLTHNGDDNDFTPLQVLLQQHNSLSMKGSPFYDSNTSKNLPIFTNNEMEIGCTLGQGEFGIVKEVSNILTKEESYIPKIWKQTSQIMNTQIENVRKSITDIPTDDISSTSSVSSFHSSAWDENDDENDNTNDNMITKERSATATLIIGLENITITESSEEKKRKKEDSHRKSMGINEHPKQYRENEENELMVDAMKGRMVLKKKCLRNGKARYAVKQLRADVAYAGSEQWEVGIVDLASEAKLLSCLVGHPNIVKLRGTVGTPGSSDFMLILDRLFLTVEDKIVVWRTEWIKANTIKSRFRQVKMKMRKKVSEKFTLNKSSNKKNNGSAVVATANASSSSVGATNTPATPKLTKMTTYLARTRSTGSGMRSSGSGSSGSCGTIALLQLLSERLIAAFDVARAFRFLHKHNIIYRDLKPANVAFDIRGHLRVFDFGLAKELKPEFYTGRFDEYLCTAMAGSRRWMAPEVFLAMPYGLSADAYSFGLFLWNIFSLKIPFGNKCSADQLYERSIVNKERPKLKQIPSFFSDRFLSMMDNCWSAISSERPSFEVICDIMQTEILELTLRIENEDVGYQQNDISDSLMDRSGHLKFYSDISR